MKGTKLEISELISGKAIWVDTENTISVGPIFNSKEEAQKFLVYLTGRFPYIDIATIGTLRLLIYYREFLNAIP